MFGTTIVIILFMEINQYLAIQGTSVFNALGQKRNVSSSFEMQLQTASIGQRSSRTFEGGSNNIDTESDTNLARLAGNHRFYTYETDEAGNRYTIDGAGNNLHYANPEGSFLDKLETDLGIYIYQDWVTPDQLQGLQQKIKELMSSGEQPTWEGIRDYCDQNNIDVAFDGSQWSSRFDNQGNLLSYTTIPFSADQIQSMLDWFAEDR